MGKAPGPYSRDLLTLPRLEVPHRSWTVSWTWTWAVDPKAQSQRRALQLWGWQDSSPVPREAFLSQPPFWSPSLSPTALFEEILLDSAPSPSACILEEPQKKVRVCPHTCHTPVHPSHPLIHSSVLSTFLSPPPLNSAVCPSCFSWSFQRLTLPSVP